MQFNEIKNLLNSHREDLSRLGGNHLTVFGSIVRNEATENSDVDILVDFDSKKGLFGFADLISIQNYYPQIPWRQIISMRNF